MHQKRCVHVGLVELPFAGYSVVSCNLHVISCNVRSLKLSGTTGFRALSAACELRRAGRTPGSKHAGGHRIRVTPVPIPNTEVKPDTADGTAWETVWESRSLPAVIHEQRGSIAKAIGPFLFFTPASPATRASPPARRTPAARSPSPAETVPPARRRSDR